MERSGLGQRKKIVIQGYEKVRQEQNSEDNLNNTEGHSENTWINGEKG